MIAGASLMKTEKSFRAKKNSEVTCMFYEKNRLSELKWWIISWTDKHKLLKHAQQSMTAFGRDVDKKEHTTKNEFGSLAETFTKKTA